MAKIVSKMLKLARTVSHYWRLRVDIHLLSIRVMFLSENDELSMNQFFVF